MTEPVSWADLVKDAGEVGTFEPVPDGDYDLLVVDATFKPTKQGKRMWSTKNRIEGGPYNGKLVWDNLVVTTDNANALMFFFRKMATLGLSKDYFIANPSDTQVAEQLKGKRFRATLETRTYMGTRSNSIKTYHETQAPGASPLPSSVSGSAPPPPPPAAAPPPPPAAAPKSAPAPAPKIETTPSQETTLPTESYTPPVETPAPTQKQEQEPAMAGASGVPAPSSPPPPPF